MLSSSKNRKLKAVAAFVFLMVAGVHFASAQATKPAAVSSEEARLRTFLDKNGGYKDKLGGYYNPNAGTYTDEVGGVVDNWQGYTYKDGSYKSKFGDYWDGPTKTFKLANGEVIKSPETSPTEAVTMMRQTVEENGGFDKDYIKKSMWAVIAKEHPKMSDSAAVSGDDARLMKYVDKNGGYLDWKGGYYDPKAGIYTDKEGGVVDNWKGYTYKDGSYKSGLGDYWDGPTKTFKLADGRVAARPGLSNADAIAALRKNVADNGGYDKDFIRTGMMDSIRQEHPGR